MVGAIFVLGVLAAAAYDVAVRRIPNWLNMSLLAAGLGANLAAGGLHATGLGALGALIGIGVFFLPFAAGWFGAGDAKLAAAMGAWLGPIGILWASLYGVAAGGVLAIVVALVGGRQFSREVATNMKIFAVTGVAPTPEKRSRRRQVPLAVALGAAGVFTFYLRGGLHA